MLDLLLSTNGSNYSIIQNSKYSRRTRNGNRIENIFGKALLQINNQY